MVCGAINKNLDQTDLHFFFKNVITKGSDYVDVLKELLPAFCRIHQCDYFMHDGAPANKSKIVTNFLNDNYIKVLELPGNLPNLNFFENA